MRVKLSSLFEIINAKSKGFETYENGGVAFVTNGYYDDSILGYVKPKKNDRVFEKKAICLSSFCEPTIQNPPFLPRGNGGSGLIVLVPIKKMSEEELYFYASQIKMKKWRFSYSRMLINRRIRNLELIRWEDLNLDVKGKINNLLPKIRKKQKIKDNKNVKLILVSELCEISKKTAPPQNSLEREGNIPYISSSSKNNGLVFFTDEVPNFKGRSLTVAKDGNDGFSFFQPFDFITSLHNFVLNPKKGYPIYFLFYIGTMIKIMSYGYNHYYPLNLNRLNKMKIPVPFNGNKLDFEFIKKIVENSYGFDEIKQYL